MTRKLFSFVLIISTFSLLACEEETSKNEAGNDLINLSEVGNSQPITGHETEAELLEAGVVSIENNGSRFFIGYEQVSANNQNPIVLRFDNGELTWKRDDYETSGDDGKGYGLLWDGLNRLYAVFSATGTQGEASEDYRRFCSEGWLTSYGSGGGPKVAVIAQLNANTGEPEHGTFLYAKKENNETNSLVIKDITFDDDFYVVLTADSWYSPLNTNKEPMTCSASSPFNYQITFDAYLQNALSTNADGCN